MLLKEFVVHCVQKFPFIYDMSYPDYKSPGKNEAFQRIADHLNKSYNSMHVTGKN